MIYDLWLIVESPLIFDIYANKENEYSCNQPFVLQQYTTVIKNKR